MAPKASLTAIESAPRHQREHEPAREQALAEAFEQFSQLSEQLTDSYRQLESRVAELNNELTEVTDQRLQELAEKERLAHRLEGLLHVLPGGVVVLDYRGVVSESNPAAVDLLGEPLEGQLWREVIARSFAPRQDDGHEVSLRDGRRISIATRNLGEDGQIILLTDQTETRRLQSELSRHERLSALGQMVSALAHQIRTPLSAAMLYAGHLGRANLAEDKRLQFAEKMSNRLNHMERQVQDMLLFVKGELPIKDAASIGQLEVELADAMEVPVGRNGANVQWVVNQRERFLECNRDALVSALLNLVNNALDACGPGAGLKVVMEALSYDQRDYLHIEVIDDGPGIAPSVLSRLGEVFVTTKAQGTGLGLAVVKAVARAHSGQFDLHSSEGEGTRAVMLLPLMNYHTE